MIMILKNTFIDSVKIIFIHFRFVRIRLAYVVAWTEAKFQNNLM